MLQNKYLVQDYLLIVEINSQLMFAGGGEKRFLQWGSSK